MEDEHRLIAQRKRKLESLRRKGIAPYPYRFDVKHRARELTTLYARLQPEERSGEKGHIAGRLMLLRRMGKVSFGQLQDESGTIQLFLRADILGDAYELISMLDLGDIVGAVGEIVKTKTGEVSLLVTHIELLAKSLRPLPEKYHRLKDEEERYRRRYLDLIMNPEVRETLSKRSVILQSVRETLTRRGFLEVETPLLQPIYGGANARPFVTHVNAWDMRMYLSISPELYLKRLLIGGYEKVFTISKNFRNEGVDQTHNPEFTMMECYFAYADYTDMMALTEELFESACRAVHGRTTVQRGEHLIDFKAPWPRVRMKDAIREHSGIDVDSLDDEALRGLIPQHALKAAPDASRGDIILALNERFVEEKLVQPVHLIDHPLEGSPLCKTLRSGDAAMIERFESYACGMELSNAYSELNDPVQQRQLLEEQSRRLRGGAQEAHPMDEEFIEALEYAMPPAGGLGVGIDRMCVLLLCAEGIRDVIFFPTMRPSARAKV